MKYFSFKGIDTWVPSTDLDNTSKEEKLLSVCNNVYFGNNYISADVNYSASNLGPNLLQYLDYSAGSIISARGFYHSERGYNVVYIIWVPNGDPQEVEESTSGLRGYVSIFINDTLLDYNQDVYRFVFYNKPKKINYNLVNDELKINLNCKVTSFLLPTHSDPLILNFDLYYIKKEIKYNNNFKKSPQWYLRVRWLGYQYDNSGNNIVTNRSGYRENYYFENFQDENNLMPFMSINGTEPPFNQCDLITTHLYRYAGCINNHTTHSNYAGLKIDNLINVSKIKFRILISGAYVEETGLRVSVINHKYPTNDGRWREIVWEGYSNHYTDYESKKKFYGNIEINLDKYEIGSHVFSIYIEFTAGRKSDVPSASATKIGITDLYIYGSKSLVVGLYKNNQRALLANASDGNKIFITIYALLGIGENNLPTRLGIPHQTIDYAINKYEIYIYNNNIGHYVLSGTVKVSNNWSLDGLLWADIEPIEDPYQTLEELYLLPYDARVDNGRHIYSEIIYKNRVYFVSNDHRVYMSHISSNLSVQRDAFPYNEEQGYGYFVVDNSKSNLALAVTPLNDMMIITTEGIYIYHITPTGSTSIKYLRMSNSYCSISSNNSLTTSLGGNSYGDYLLWCDNNAIYLYDGSSNPPKNLVFNILTNYYQNIDAYFKSKIVAFYYALRREYWILISNSTFLIYELDYKKFRQYSLEHSELEFVSFLGFYNGKPSILCKFYGEYKHIIIGDGQISAGFIVTHLINPSENTAVLYKVLQEVYIEFGELTTNNIVVSMVINLDNIIALNYHVNTNKKYHKWLVPHGIKFKRISFSILIPPGVRILDFGFSYEDDILEPLGDSL